MMLQNNNISYFGRIPNTFLDGTLFSNITEMFFDREVCALLNLCDTDDKVLKNVSSDYELFAAFCKAVPLLRGHPIVSKVSFALKAYFDIDLTCGFENMDSIWREVSEQLFTHALTGADYLKKVNQTSVQRVLLDSASLLMSIPSVLEPVLNARGLLPITTVTNWTEWETMLVQTLDAFCAAGAKSVYFELQNFISLDIPSRYHIDKALTNQKRLGEESPLLSTQLFRCLCVECKKRNLLLYLNIYSDPQKTEILLDRMIKNLGSLPDIVWFTADPAVRDFMISYSLHSIPNTPHCAFLTSLYRTDHEMALAYESLVARYPAGALTILYGDDLRYAEYERKRFEAVIS